MRGHYWNLSEDKEIKKRNYANAKNKNMSETDKERKKEHMKNHHKRKDLLNYLINRVKELENICLNN